jgi:hypothetical protein
MPMRHADGGPIARFLTWTQTLSSTLTHRVDLDGNVDVEFRGAA